nr:MAG TPA: hypothetical protein [Caudoviricetes sp.]
MLILIVLSESYCLYSIKSVLDDVLVLALTVIVIFWLPLPVYVGVIKPLDVVNLKP